MRSKFLIIVLISTLLMSCGYSIVDQTFLKDYKFVNTGISGDKKIVYLLRNKLKKENKNASKSIKIDINTKKLKQIKEKNIQNEVTKYEVTITAIVKYYLLEENKSGEFKVRKNDNYAVGTRYSETLNNEKKLINNMVKELADQILENMVIRIDEL